MACPFCRFLVLALFGGVNVCILLVIRRDRNPNVSSATKRAASLKALKNKDQMSVETALEVFHPNVQRAIPTQDVVTLVPEIYTSFVP